MTIKERKRALHKKTKADVSDPLSAKNSECIKAVEEEAEISEEKNFTGVLGKKLTVEVVKANIVEETTDAITNAANEIL